jgi:hypothetical protein
MHYTTTELNIPLNRFEDKKTGNKECISNAERFYDHLYMLLRKRGKKDFAINIR